MCFTWALKEFFYSRIGDLIQHQVCCTLITLVTELRRELRIHNCISARHKPMSFEWFICLKPTGIVKPKWGLYSWSLATNTHRGIKIKAHPAGSLCQVLSCSDWLVRHMFDLIYCLAIWLAGETYVWSDWLAKHMIDLIGWALRSIVLD